ncbi:hypothetical protein [Ralstonia pseudosolanacearum]|uniref:hypothetical protein n=2 Tax=Ralstonia pseudosolanacearum TaxID=1310165 RepID=UPI001D019E71|nr:hypothetical protein [Ralstonia pseudosolanacearum]
MIEVVDRIRMNIVTGAYEVAYLIGRDALQEPGCDRGKIVAVLCELAAKIRFDCMGLAVRKSDYGADYVALESLLRKTNELTGQDMYGFFKAR